jgi:hypothetical protein
MDGVSSKRSFHTVTITIQPVTYRYTGTATLGMFHQDPFCTLEMEFIALVTPRISVIIGRSFELKLETYIGAAFDSSGKKLNARLKPVAHAHTFFSCFYFSLSLPIPFTRHLASPVATGCQRNNACCPLVIPS